MKTFKEFNESHAAKLRRNLSDEELSKVLSNVDKKEQEKKDKKEQEEKYNKLRDDNFGEKKEKELEVAESTEEDTNEDPINEDGDGGAGAGGAGAGSSGSGDVSGGVAYFNQGSVDGMGDVKNSTVSVIPGDPDGSEAGSGDVGVYLPAQTFTKNTGITGNLFHKAGKAGVSKKFFQDAKKVKDKMGLGKTMTFQDFSKN